MNYGYGSLFGEVENMSDELNVIDNSNTIDFDDATTIVNYGQGLLDEMGTVMNGISKMIKPRETNDLDIEEKLSKINNLSNYLNEKKNLNATQGLIPKLVDKALEVKCKLFGKEEYTESFADQYLEINEQIDAIVDIVNDKMNLTIENINIEKAYVDKMNIYIPKLEELIKNGEEKLDEFKKQTEAKNQISRDSMDDNLEREIKLCNVKIELLEKRINSLKKFLVVAKDTLLNSMLKRNTDESLLLEYQEYNSTTVNLLRNQSTSIITTKLQRDSLVEQRKLTDATNDILLKNSKNIIGNIEKVNELKEKGSIYDDTLKDLESNIKKGIDLVIKGNEREKELRQKEDNLLNEMVINFEQYKKSISDVVSIEDASFISGNVKTIGTKHE